MRPEQASAAVNCWMDKKQPRPLPELLPVAGISVFSASVKTIYRFDDIRWFQWNDEVDVVRAPLINDSTNRTIWTGDDFPRFTSTVIMQGGGFTFLPACPSAGGSASRSRSGPDHKHVAR